MSIFAKQRHSELDSESLNQPNGQYFRDAELNST